MQKIPFMAALFYVPIRQVGDVQAVMKELTVRYVKPDETAAIDVHDDVAEEQQVDPDNLEIKCFDLSKPGYIGLPRSYGLEKFGHLPYADITVKVRRRSGLYPRNIKARDTLQAEFMETVAMLVRGPSPVDIVANARTGTGKTVTALWVAENAIQDNVLVTVPTVYLLNQWRSRIRSFMGDEWTNKHVGHLQQGTMDMRTITLGVAASLARRDYPAWVKRHASAIYFDEWHKIPTPTIGSILAKYPASVRIGWTATNRRDAFAKVARLHMGKPRVTSRQEVMRPQVYIHEFSAQLPARMPVFSDRHMLTLLSRMRDRNRMLGELIVDGWERGRVIIGLSDRTDQLVELSRLIPLLTGRISYDDIGIIAGKYKMDGQTIKPTQAQKDHIADTCQVILATYGIFDTGADIDRLDMGVELTPRVNLRQAIGRVLRIRPGKPTPEWHSITDRIIVRQDTGAEMFSDPNGREYPSLIRDAEARLASFAFQNGTVNYVRD